ncbi:S-4TM family putative pore-forming effector [Enterococcus hirae]|nr:S-4TM family putative pore-forming effector [Enterococcus faecium]MDK4360061.1 S-4TM family putative pore-forming effector [Enterococcus faecium]MDK4453108.1 S-4TM family putative pore-forming effector [Enterococcus faecium]MDQ8452499.1 S-4TM family putative pore-forming effector [Enterococcus faecium]MDQ8469848.1 S-4TM family putative pore-forming effector [Enterococcus faecium]HAQ7627640.1 hypothetical protein [Enterococcus faecium]
MELLERQNEMKSLEVQATARLLYNRSQTIDLVEWSCVLLLPILKIIFVHNIAVNYLFISWFFLSFIFDYYIDYYTEIASELKKGFDYYVFAWNDNIPNRLLNVTKKYTAKKRKFYEEQTSQSGTDKPNGVKDWYTMVDKEVTQEEAIKAAMRENIYFDDKINNVANALLISIVGITVYVLAFSGISFYEVLFGLFVTFASVTKKWYSTFSNIKKVRNINRNIDKLLCDQNVDLYYLQSEIDKKRSISRTSNKLIYFFQRKGTHKEVSFLKTSK